MRILVVGEASGARNALRAEGFETQGIEANQVAGATDALVVVDAPHATLRTVLSQRTAQAVLAVGDGGEEVAALELGADEFVTRPIAPKILALRAKILLRRVSRLPSESLLSRSVGSMTLLRRDRTLLVQDKPIKLTGVEFSVLWALAEIPGRVLSRDELFRSVHGSAYDGIDRGIDIHISRIRRKLSGFNGASPEIQSVRGSGYMLLV